MQASEEMQLCPIATLARLDNCWIIYHMRTGMTVSMKLSELPFNKHSVKYNFFQNCPGFAMNVLDPILKRKMFSTLQRKRKSSCRGAEYNSIWR